MSPLLGGDLELGMVADLTVAIKAEMLDAADVLRLILADDRDRLVASWVEANPDLEGIGRRDEHPSTEPRNDYGHDDTPVPCGQWKAGYGTALCPFHLIAAQQEYPQGWAYYPGDVCRHGKYVGGVGVDWMCQPCEDGE